MKHGKCFKGMKKKIWIILFISIAILLSVGIAILVINLPSIKTFFTPASCQNVSREDSQNNYSMYEQAVNDIARSYGFETRHLSRTNTGIEITGEVEDDMQMEIPVGGECVIVVEFSNFESEEVGEEGMRKEIFSVKYFAPEGEAQRELELFSRLVNEFSAKQISAEACASFLAGAQGKGSDEKAYDFWGDWILEYETFRLSSYYCTQCPFLEPHSTCLGFHGYTKACAA